MRTPNVASSLAFHLQMQPIPNMFRISKMTVFEPTSYPIRYVVNYNIYIDLHTASEGLKCRAFPTTLDESKGKCRQPTMAVVRCNSARSTDRTIDAGQNDDDDERSLAPPLTIIVGHLQAVQPVAVSSTPHPAQPTFDRNLMQHRHAFPCRSNILPFCLLHRRSWQQRARRRQRPLRLLSDPNRAAICSGNSSFKSGTRFPSSPNRQHLRSPWQLRRSMKSGQMRSRSAATTGSVFDQQFILWQINNFFPHNSKPKIVDSQPLQSSGQQQSTGSRAKIMQSADSKRCVAILLSQSSTPSCAKFIAMRSQT
ncbi:hypothetical protein ACLOJK_011747 [Asimina triloba]